MPVLLFVLSVVLFISMGPVQRLLPNHARRTIDIGIHVTSIIAAAAGVVFGVILFVRTRDAAAVLGVCMNLVWIPVLIFAAADMWHHHG
jgi:TRAP-type C4-dicarboxylate transport system permease small subunit